MSESKWNGVSFTILCATYNVVIGVGSDPVHQYIQCRKYAEADQRGLDEQVHILHVEQQKQFADHGEGKGQMDARSDQRQEKYRKRLARKVVGFARYTEVGCKNVGQLIPENNAEKAGKKRYRSGGNYAF